MVVLVGKTLGNVLNNRRLKVKRNDSHEEVIRLDVSVYEVLAVNVFNATYELVSQEKDCF